MRGVDSMRSNMSRFRRNSKTMDFYKDKTTIQKIIMKIKRSNLET